MKISNLGLLLIAPLTLAAWASAGTIPQWPATQPYTWDTAPFTPVSGTVSIQALDTLQMASYGSGSKNDWWLPYGTLNGSAWAERLCVANLINGGNTAVTNIHVKVLDQRGASGGNGWAVIFIDTAGRIFDFGVRPFYRPPYIMAHEWDGTSWVNWAGNDFFTPYYTRSTVNPAYYTMDFAQNADGTLTWTIAGWDPTNLDFLASTNTSSIAYGAITGVYLSASAPATASVNYKWTEFSVSPQVFSPPTLHIAPTNATEIALWWPSAWTTNFVVYTNADLSTTTWGLVTNTPTDDGTSSRMTLPIEARNQFFRLRN